MTVRGSMYGMEVVVAVAALLRPRRTARSAGAVEPNWFHAPWPVRRCMLGWVLCHSARVPAVSGTRGHLLETPSGAASAAEVVPNPIAPVTARREQAHASSTPTLLYKGGFANPVKGGALLVVALRPLRQRLADPLDALSREVIADARVE